MKRSRFITLTMVLSAVLVLIAALACVFFGSVRIPPAEIVRILVKGSSSNQVWDYIVLRSRIPQMVTALLAGVGLSLCGLMMQTLFHNPLADPSILGISSGANLGAAIVLLFMGGTISFSTISIFGQFAVILGALTGSLATLLLIIWFASRIQSSVMILIVGVMVGYLTSSLISILNSMSTAQGVHSLVLWGLGNFSGVGLSKLLFFSIATIIPIVLACTQIKVLNAFLLGEDYVRNLGINVSYKRTLILILTGILTAVITAFCGPIAFIGLAVPHMARLLVKSSNHNLLMPLSALLGGLTALVCNLITVTGIPLNAITSFMGVPVILYVIVGKRQTRYMQ